MEPPNLRFITPIFHPNIDSSGRICLDIIKMAPNVCHTIRSQHEHNTRFFVPTNPRVHGRRH